MSSFQNSLRYARQQDRLDPLRSFRSQFHLPKSNGKSCIYLCGNSLGLQPRLTQDFVQQELSDWAKLGVEGHFHAHRPWLHYHKFSKKSLARLVGARPTEVVSMNQLTVNLHLLLASFYQPTPGRYKILTEAHAFSSDQYAVESQLKWHGINPGLGWVELKPRPGEHTLRTADILDAIQDHGDSLAVVLLGAVQYYSGQFFDVKAITHAAHQVGAFAGFDLAHAIGNVPLALHDHNVDFAVWCSYKYLNSGPGGMAGAFVHDRHGSNANLPRLAGWWGHNEKERFQMKKGFVPMPGADGWQVSNFPVLSGAAHLASLRIFDQAGIKALRKKSTKLTGYLEFLLQSLPQADSFFSIITPAEEEQRGCQLSILMKQNGKKVFDRLTRKGVMADWREPDVIRVAPVPLYNSFEDVFRFVELFRTAISR
ncbi:MAG: kynureninase [Cyclobacteriaceae bacterium]|jgi:kynureninase|nr:kynureninase [Flammeovirgaceae bacterium]